MKYKLLLGTCLTLVAVLFFTFRFYNIENRLIFDWDQQNIATRAIKITQEHRPVLLGARSTSDKGFFLAPYFTYFVAPFFAITKGHPNALYGVVALVNVMFFTLSFFVLKRMFDLKVAILFLLFWAINPYLTVLDVTPWVPILLPTLTILSWWAFMRTSKKPTHLNALGLGLILGLGVNHHFQFIYVAMMSLLAFALNSAMKHKRVVRADVGKVLLIIAGMLATLTPLVLFDLRNDFLNTRLFFDFFTSDIANTTERGRFLWTETLVSFFGPITGTQSVVSALIAYTGFTAAAAYIALHKSANTIERTFFIALGLLMSILPLVLTIYNKRPSEYYFLWLYPYLYVTVIVFAMRSRLTFLLLAYVCALAYFGINTLPTITANNDFSLQEKDNVALTIKHRVLSGTKIGVGIGMPPGLDNGFRYLLSARGVDHEAPAPKLPLVRVNNPKEDEDISVNKALGVSIPPEISIPACFPQGPE